MVPGRYTVELAAAGRSYEETITVEPDPRIAASQADLIAQAELARGVTDALAVSYDGYFQLADVRAAIARGKTLAALAAPGEGAQALITFNQQLGARNLPPLPVAPSIPAAPSCGQTSPMSR